MTLQLQGNKLKNLEGFGVFRKSDPFYEICRRSADGNSWDSVYRSNFVKNNLSPLWDEVTLEMSVLCSGELETPILIRVYDHEGSGDHDLMGKVETTPSALFTAGRESTELQLEDDKGTISVKTATLSGPTFVDYIAGGCKVNVVVALDFTGSNGDPRQEGTLHYFHKDGGRNDYEKAIAAVVSILEKYDTDQMFPVYGFGAKYDGLVRHCFQCGAAPEHRGVSGVLQAYRDTFRSGLIMSGPTVFADVIQTAASHAVGAQEQAKRRGGQAYTILLILTDGAVTDPSATAAAKAEGIKHHHGGDFLWCYPSLLLR